MNYFLRYMKKLSPIRVLIMITHKKLSYLFSGNTNTLFVEWRMSTLAQNCRRNGWFESKPDYFSHVIVSVDS